MRRRSPTIRPAQPPPRRVLVPLLAVTLLASIMTSAPSAAQGSGTSRSASQGAPVAGATGSASDAVFVPSSGAAPSSWDAVVGGSARQLDEEPLDSSSTPLPGDLRRLQVKFTEEAGVTLSGGTLDDGAEDSALDRILAGLDDLAVEALFAETPRQLATTRALGEARTGEAVPDLASWFLLEVGSVAGGADLRDALEQLAIVEMVQPDPELVGTQIVDPEEDNQRYLDLAPIGHGTEWAWPQPGGTGSRVTIAVIDSGFDTSHPDVDRADAPGVAIPHEPARDPRHGLQVLGILVADDDGAGIRGIAHDAGIRTINSGDTGADVARAIGLATAALGPGDVLSISQGIRAESGSDIVLPLVYSSAARDALRAAAAKGIITVVSAGNGGANLDAYANRLGNDSPATIVVGGGGSGSVPGCGGGTAGARVAVSNYGSRVDMQGWGECVRTTTIGNSYTWWGFTSAATPMVAGAAALLSSMIETQRGVTPTGAQARTILRSTGLGQVGRATIGPRPDLRSAMGVVGEMPDNDMWARAERLRDLPVRLDLDTSFAGVELDEPDPGCGPMTDTVWYRIDAPRDLDITVDTIGSNHDTVVAVWRQDGRTLVPLGCNDDIGARRDQSRVRTSIARGGTYFVQVGAGRRGGGSLVVRVRAGSVVGAGCDVDGDGGTDPIVGVPDEGVRRAARAGQAVVYPDWTRRRPVTAARITQEWPGIEGDSEAGDAFGRSLACGDFDGDGFDDVAIGAPTESLARARSAGAVRVVRGTPGGPSRAGASTFTEDDLRTGAATRRDRFGAALAAGDFDGDGYDDLAVGTPGENRGERGAGAVSIIPGGPSGLALGRAQSIGADTPGVPGRSRANAGFGAALAAGDFDFDGRDDLAIGVPGHRVGARRAAGAVVILHGTDGGLGTRRSQRIHENSPGMAGVAVGSERFGSVVAVGHLGGDAFADLVVGVPRHKEAGRLSTGQVIVVRGAPRGLRPSSSRIVAPAYAGAGAGDRFGTAVSIGDVDGDDFGDLVVGAPGRDAGSASGSGIAQVRFARRVGVAARTDLVLVPGAPGMGRSGQPGDGFGTAVAVADTDADGTGLVVVGVPGATVIGPNRALRDVGRLLVVAVDASRAPVGDARPVTQRRPAAGADERGDRFGSVLLG